MHRLSRDIPDPAAFIQPDFPKYFFKPPLTLHRTAMISSYRKEDGDRMTIKEFAQLCACNAQTLRYYDRIGLLRPRQVDQWSRYRYYEAEQAIDFVKIKNLQLADFTIEEIKALLKQDDQAIYHAFDRKIAQQQEKLVQIKKIQQSYLREKSAMEEILHSFTDFLLGVLNDYQGLEELGLAAEEGEEVRRLLLEYMESSFLSVPQPDPQAVTLQIDDELIQGADRVLDRLDTLAGIQAEREFVLNYAGEDDSPDADAEWEIVWECHDWQHVSDFINQIPALEEDGQYRLQFLYDDEEEVSKEEGLAFTLYMLGAMLKRNPGAKGIKGCEKDNSPDGRKHFYLKQKK